jgi:hypothetical protein
LTHCAGIEALDQSALWTKGELRVASTSDPERLRRRLHKSTGKSVGLVILKPQAAAAAAGAADKAAEKEAAAAFEDLLRRTLLQQQQQQGQAAGWATPTQVLPAAAYGYGAAAYHHHPWAVQAHAQQAEAYPSYNHHHHPAAYPAEVTGGAWGAYACPPSAAPAQFGHAAYYGAGGWPY